MQTEAPFWAGKVKFDSCMERREKVGGENNMKETRSLACLQ